jgi:hypothetical protein
MPDIESREDVASIVEKCSATPEKSMEAKRVETI